MSIMVESQETEFTGLSCYSTRYYIECWSLNLMEALINDHIESVHSNESNIIKFEIVHLETIGAPSLATRDTTRQVIHYKLTQTVDHEVL